MSAKPGLLVVGELPAWDLEALTERFDVHLYYAAEDKAGMLARGRDTIRAIATKGEVGADAAMMDALPKVEIIAITMRPNTSATPTCETVPFDAASITMAPVPANTSA